MLKSPITLHGDMNLWWDIHDGDGHIVAHMTAITYDGSCRREQYPTGIIRTREDSKTLAQEIHRRLSIHEELVEMLTEATDDYAANCEGGEADEWVQFARSLLARAKGEEIHALEPATCAA